MIYHISTEKEWAAYAGNEAYAPAAFEKEGFIHASDRDQLKGVMARYYSGRTDLLLVMIDERKLSSKLVYEQSTNRELYPHIYGMLNKDAVVKVIAPFDETMIARID